METTRIHINRYSVLERIPVGRQGYVEANMALNEIEIQSNSFGQPKTTRVSLKGLWRATRALNSRNLDPPLPEDLAEIIHQMNDTAYHAENIAPIDESVPKGLQPTSLSRPHTYTEIVGPKTFEPYREAAELVIRAALDHGNLARQK
jgi:hypothetical protein